MRYKITPPTISGSGLKSRLLHLPLLGGVTVPKAQQAMVALFKTPARPGLDTARQTIFSSKGAISHAWRQEMDCGILVIFADRSALIFARTDAPGIFEMLPLVFELPSAVPFGTNRPETGQTNMVYDHRGSGRMRFGIRPQARVEMFFDICAPDYAPKGIADLLVRTLESLELECASWIKAFRRTPIHRETAWPIALAKIARPASGNDPKLDLSKWLVKVSSYCANVLGGSAKGPFIALRCPVFSQSDGSVHFETEVSASASDDPAGEAIARHLGKALPDALKRNLAPIPVDELLPIVPSDDPRAFGASPIWGLDFEVSAFSREALSNHEILLLDTIFGLRSIVASAREGAA